MLRDCVWLWGEGFFSFLKGSSITVGPPGGFARPLEDDVQLETLGSGWELRPFLETGRPRPPSMDWILRSSAGSSFWDGNRFLSFLGRALGRSSFWDLAPYLCNLRWGERPTQVGSLDLFGRRAVFPRMQHPLLGGLTVNILFGVRDPVMQRLHLSWWYSSYAGRNRPPQPNLTSGRKVHRPAGSAPPWCCWSAPGSRSFGTTDHYLPEKKQRGQSALGTIVLCCESTPWLLHKIFGNLTVPVLFLDELSKAELNPWSNNNFGILEINPNPNSTPDTDKNS